MIFRSRKRTAAATGLAEPAAELEGFESLSAEVGSLAEENRRQRDRERERRLLTLRHRAGVALIRAEHAVPRFADPDEASLPERSGPELPEFAPGDLTPGLLRAAILRDGCLLVRGIVKRERALEIAAGIDRAFDERDAYDDGAPLEDAALYEPFEPDPPYELMVRPWIKEGGGVLAADAPSLAFDMLDAFERNGLVSLIEGYLGERPLISADKSTLRKAEPHIAGAWHQDGAFMGEVRAMNVWLSLSRCGDESPGLDLVPRRLDDFVQSGTEGTYLDIQVSQAMAEETAGEYGIARPIFEPGDALLFDDRFLHQTGSDPEMPKPRFAIESWFFGPSAFPGDYVPILA